MTLLGTGAPEPSPTRFGPATLVQAGGLSLLFDAGRGVTVRLHQLGIPSGKGIDAVFLTHYHSDHVAGLPDLWMTGYMFGPFGSRAKPMRLWGPSDGTAAPSGAAKIARGLTEAFSDDMRIRQADEHIAVVAMRIEAHDFHEDRVVFNEAGSKSLRSRLSRRPDQAVGRLPYRLWLKVCNDFRRYPIRRQSDKTRGDDRSLDPRGLCDIPKTRSIAAIKAGSGSSHLARTSGHNFLSREAETCSLFAFCPHWGTTADEIVFRTRTTYQGPLEAGEDLMRFTIGSGVTVKRWNAELRKYPD